MGQKVSETGQRPVSRLVEEYIETHPVTRNALQHGIVNYSALARVIQEKLGVPRNFEAFLIAVRRNAENLMKLRAHLETKVQKILVESNFEIKTKISILTLENNASVLQKLSKLIDALASKKVHFHIIQGSEAITFIIEQKYLSETKDIEKYILKHKRNKIEIIIKSPQKIEEVPGVVSMIMNAFSERNINVLETLSCYTDTILLINPEDLPDSVKLLEKLLKE